MKVRVNLRRRGAAGDYDLLPLINIVFLLLVFFLLSATLAPVDDLDHLPASAQARAGRDEPSVLRVRADGALEFAGVPLPPAELPAAARAWQQAHPDLALPVEADAGASAPAFLRLLHSLRDAGVQQVRLRARPAGAG